MTNHIYSLIASVPVLCNGSAKHNSKLQYHLYELLFTFFIHFSKGTVEVYKAHVRMKLPLYMLGLAMHHRPNYPEVCLKPSKCSFIITENHIYSLTSSCIAMWRVLLSFDQVLRSISEMLSSF